jgi:hypothetical protein
LIWFLMEKFNSYFISYIFLYLSAKLSNQYVFSYLFNVKIRKINRINRNFVIRFY